MIQTMLEKSNKKIKDLNMQGLPKASMHGKHRKNQSRPEIKNNRSSENEMSENINQSNPFEQGSDIEDIPDVPNVEKSNRNWSTIIGDKPNIIDNTDIEGENEGQLLENIQFNRDFIILPQNAWDLLYEWYGGGPTFARKAIIGKDSKPILELHPPLISTILCDNKGNLNNDSVKRIFVSSTNKLSEVFLKI